MKSIDLNADVAEGAPHDEELIGLVSSINVACAAHAGDEDTMRRAMHAAKAAGIAVGAHPGYEDRRNFGRQPLDCDPASLRASLRDQLSRFLGLCEECGVVPHHVKPHGALYHQANQNPEWAALLIDTIAEYMPETRLYGPPRGALADAAPACGLKLVAEGFVDRRYAPDGSLVPRSDPHAVIESAGDASRQAVEIALHRQVTTIAGSRIPLPAATLCIHGDGVYARELLTQVREQLQENKVAILSC